MEVYQIWENIMIEAINSHTNKKTFNLWNGITKIVNITEQTKLQKKLLIDTIQWIYRTIYRSWKLFNLYLEWTESLLIHCWWSLNIYFWGYVDNLKTEQRLEYILFCCCVLNVLNVLNSAINDILLFVILA